MQTKGPSAYIAEFLGTLLLVFFIATVLSVEKGSDTPYLDFAVIGLLHAFVLAMLIATLAGVSGAHFNPAVTATMTVLRKIGPVDALIYLVMQFAGGIVGALLCKAILLDEGKTVKYGAPGASEMLDGKMLSGAVVEAIGTFMLMWAIMGVAVNAKNVSPLTPWVIGATLGAMVMAFGPLTGGSFNPARALGPNLVGAAGNWGDLVVAFVVAPVVGAVLAGVGYTQLALRS